MAENLGQQAPQKEGNIFPTNVVEWKNYLSSQEADLAVFENINSLRQEVEKPEDWARTKELAKQEIERVPADIIPKLFERLEPYLKAMPSGHSRRHVQRDFINSLLINQDPWVKSLDDVERFIGIMGGAFHDIGNSVIGRYEETKRFTVLPRLYDQMLSRIEHKLQEANSTPDQGGIFREAGNFALQILEGLKKDS